MSSPDATAPLAIGIDNLVKTYRLYPNRASLVVDRLGLSALMPWMARKFKEYTALDGLSLQIRHGEKVGIVGRNGAGKTTLLKLITGVFGPTSGSVSVDGDVQALMQVGLGFHPDFSGLDNIRAGLESAGIADDALEAAIADVVDFVELGEFLHQPMSTYSLGMKSRLQFATATAIRPDILVVDEILGAGDAYFSAKSAVRMNRLASSGCTLLLVSHSMQQICQYCDRAVWLAGGKIIADGPAPEITSAYEAEAQKAMSKALKPAESGLVHKDWIRSLGDSDAGAAGDGEVPDVLEDGSPVYRWRGEPGAKVVNVRFSPDRGHPLPPLGELEIGVEVQRELAGDISYCAVINFFSLDGNRLGRAVSPVFVLDGSAGRATALARFAPLPLGGRTYLLSVALYSNDPTRDLQAVRYDLLAKSFTLDVSALDYHEQPVVHLLPQWSEAGASAAGTA